MSGIHQHLWCRWLHPLAATALFSFIVMLAFTKPVYLMALSVSALAMWLTWCAVVFLGGRREEAADDGCPACASFGVELPSSRWLIVAPLADVLFIVAVCTLSLLYFRQAFMGQPIASSLGSERLWYALVVFIAAVFTISNAAHARASTIRVATAAQHIN